MKRTNFPKDWIVVTSKSHPNRVYYFNVKTNKSSWELPADLSHDSPKGKKRKKNASDDSAELRPTTPEMPKKSDDRPVLRAKRSILPAEKDASGQRASSVESKETPQMRQLREKMLERQAKGNASRRSKIAASVVAMEEQKDETMTEKPAPSTPSAVQNFTPQMRVLLEKMKNRKSTVGPPKSPQKNEEVGATLKVTPLRRPKARPLTPADSPTTDLAKQTRRSSRLTINETTSPSTPSSSKANSKKAEKRPDVAKSSSLTEDRAKVPRLGRSALAKKNLAEERLVHLRKSLGDENSIDTGPASPAPEISQNCKILLHDISSGSSKETASPPSIYENAEIRMKLLRERLQNKSLYAKRMPSNRIEENDSTLEPMVDVNTISSATKASDSFYEEMEWEPIEDDKIMREIEAVRSHINSIDDDPKNSQKIVEHSLDLPDGPSEVKSRRLYIVVDTNVFLSNLGAIEEARDAVFRSHGRPFIVVPWTVIRELDFIKDDKSMTRPECLRAKARQAVRFLHEHFSSKHPRVLGQTPMDVANNKNKFEIDCPDDEILQTCLQIRLSNNFVVLLSYDKNLCNKAMIHDLATLGRHDPLEKVDYLHASEARVVSLFTQHLQGEEQDVNTVPIAVKELRIAEEILDQAKEVLTSFLTVVVAKEMQNLYNEHWEKYTIIRPPWSVFSVLKCAIKHWIAAVSESFTRRAEPLLKKLLDAMNSIPDSGRKLGDVSHILETINDLLQCVKVDKYTNITVRSGRAIAELRVKCVDAMQKLRKEQLHDAVGFQKDDEEARANAAFKQFEEVYAFARDVCGLASEAVGMPCSFPFKKLFPLPTIEDVKAMQPDVAANLNRLLQVLSTALEELNALSVDHRVVLALYNALSTFMPDQKGELQRDFSPLDVYWCLKIKEKVLRSGLGQLQELSNHFCRMASFRCT